ncbi:RNA polymerase sigma factor [Sphingobacterium yanglingense]|uniref:RNA polymerase sigma-70 factor (ECF subfamily) n=1 Tax=Sphingobacterium yanglingense TaxID=1437280 RepID=A0A4V3DCX5_9SPHI|nr:RNA polymerase sigma-70 factor [Sphingobacterium yanglingense]TDQ73683.1 RNA polymerase sigma-70 factor (ECF subfamily) [Sphingobacterium yanglingense]
MEFNLEYNSFTSFVHFPSKLKSQKKSYTADKELVNKINKGDHRAFTELVNRYKEKLYRHAYRMIPDTEVCNDIIQDTFLAVWAIHEKWQITDSALPYLYQSVRNKILNHLSREEVSKRYIESFQLLPQQGHCYTEEKILERELLNLIEERKSDLAPRTREIFELNREQHLTYKEIGQKLNISEKTAKKQVHNALKYLRAKLASFLFSLLFLFFFIF